ncbi:MAG TPA: nitroreductase family protein [Flavobacteriaceae bacterium]|nr:nitroreductase family protein [Flavobacteriaceae bacterium]
MKKPLTIEEAINYRRSVRIYNEEIPINSEVVKKCIEMATLAPNSSNLQLWEFHHITTQAVIQQLLPACLNQKAVKTAQQLLVVVVRKDLWKKRANQNLNFIKKGFNKPLSEYSKAEKMVYDYYNKLIPFVYTDFLGIFGCVKYGLSWLKGLFSPTYRQLRKSDLRIVAHKSAGLAAQTFMVSMAAEGLDTCPLEGIDSLRIKKILNLPMASEINMVISCGVRKPEGVYGERFRVPFNEVYKKW